MDYMSITTKHSEHNKENIVSVAANESSKKEVHFRSGGGGGVGLIGFQVTNVQKPLAIVRRIR